MKIKIRKHLLKGDKPNLQSCGFYSVTAKIYNPQNNNLYRKFVFVLDFDLSDCCDYYETEKTTMRQRADYFVEVVYSFLGYFDYFDQDSIKELAKRCKYSRDYYNKNIYPKEYIWV